jgi:transcriptional regulator with XRE-family HTH domain
VDYQPSPRTKKVLAQLEAEMAAHGLTMKDVAEQTGRPYNTFRRYVKGERAMPADDLLDSLDAIGVGYADFMRRAAER